MFLFTVTKPGLRQAGALALCAVCLAGTVTAAVRLAGRSVAASATVQTTIENTQDIGTYFTGYGFEVDLSTAAVDKVKIPKKWDDSFTAFNQVVQESGLDDAARAAFLQKFTPDPAQTLLGFGVMGGIFGEGVDLVGDRLIGCAIVGVGLPQVNPRQEILRRYYDEQSGTGFDYAYRYPGMNKVLQAAGRVIRTAGDRGVVLLLDDRFARSEYTRLFPRHWQHLKYLNGTEALKEELDRFWGQGSSR